MDDVRDAVLVEHALERREVRDVAGDERHALPLAGIEDLGEPTVVAAEVEADDRRPFADQLPDGPRADAAQRARDEEPLLGHECCPLASKRHVFSRRPMRSISTVTRSPSPRNRGGSRNAPTPPGVPVAMTSPGSSVNERDR